MGVQAMNRHEFLEQLKRKLARLPEGESAEALEYYSQYFEDAGVENEEAVIAELGSPANVAAQIIAEFAIKEAELPVKEKTAYKGLSTVWIVILSIFAAPAAVPLAIAFAVLVISLLVVVLAFVFSIGVLGVALMVGGIAMMFISFPLIMQSFPTAVFYLGSGLAAFGLGLPVLWGAFSMAKKCFNWLAKLAGNFILKRRNAK
jgi:uncharacterized membrane protein